MRLRGKQGFWMRFAACLLRPTLNVLAKRDWRGREHAPRTGGLIIAFNHISYADPFFVAHFVYDLPRLPRFLAKIEVFRIPLAGIVVKGAGQIPVHRNTADAAEALRDAIAAVERGECLVIYPEGTVTKDPDLWPMRARTGVARLALTTGAPVIPVAQWGAQDVYQKGGKPHLFPRKRIQMLMGPPVDLSPWIGREQTSEVLHEVTDAIMSRIRDQLVELRGEPAPATVFDPRATAADAERPGTKRRSA